VHSFHFEKTIDCSRIRIRKARLRSDLSELSQFGKEPGGGVARTALSIADLEARRWFQGRMREAGLKIREDAAANLIGRLEPSEGPADAPCLAIGSHIDTVSHGGRFDGALGICGALEAIRAIRESGIPLPCPLELIVFTDEEGSHFAGTFGSRAMLGLLEKGELYRSGGGEAHPTLAESLKRMGKKPERIREAVRSPCEFLAFLEMHIEQGPVLDSAKIPIGIVEGIVFLERSIIRTTGQSGHAGTIPMDKRDDALVKAAKIVTGLNRIVRSAGKGMVGTIGQLQVFPGVFNIIPQKVEMTLDLRSMEKNKLDSVKREIRKMLHLAGNSKIETLNAKGGVTMDRAIRKDIERSCRERKTRWRKMSSRAGHDAMTFASQGIPTGMIFIPCLEGKSHCPEESIRWEDAAAGTQILADTIMRMGYRCSSSPVRQKFVGK
jgi:hydantoinase/carbamoylase family amidase